MLKPRQCPYCHTIYRYQDIVRIKGRRQICYHCHKPFDVHKRWQILPVLIACVLMTAVNLIMLNTTKDITKSTFVIMMAADAVVILVSLLTAPFFTRLVKVS